MKYQAYLDGLRAVAIIFVLIFHAGLTLFPSGFIGVDIFFVISGFLITSIIHQSLTDNSFSFIEFYKRRLWRLQPVLLVAMTAIALLTLFFYLPEDLILYARSTRKILFFVSNIFFEKTTTGYFSPDSNQLPLLHTWSLSIEWQCYFLLPFLMYLLHKLIPQKYISICLYIIAAILFIISLDASSRNPESTYYYFSSRLFEFFIGASLAVLPKHYSPDKNVLNIVAMTAFASLFYIALQSDIKSGFPNYYALAVCLSTAVIIFSGQSNTQIPLVRFLSTKPLVFIGLISYSLYVWHWPILAVLRYHNIEETASMLTISFFFIFLASWCSWKFIERPARTFYKIKFAPTLVILLIIPIVITQASYIFLQRNTGFPQRFNDELTNIYATLNQYKSEDRSSCMGQKPIDVETVCRVGSKKSDRKNAFLFGDSFSNHAWGFMDVIGENANISILAQGMSSCLALPDIYLYDWWNHGNKVYQKCYDQTLRYYSMVKKNHYDYVILGQAWDVYLKSKIINQFGDKHSPQLTRERLHDALDKALGIIIESGAIPVIIEATASMKANPHDCFFKHIKLRTPYDPELCNFKLQSDAQDQWLRSLFKQMQNKYPQLVLIDPKIIQCEDGTCLAGINGIPVYRDASHITDYASWQLGKRYLEKYNNPFKTENPVS